MFNAMNVAGTGAVAPGSGGPAISGAMKPFLAKFPASAANITAQKTAYLTPAGASKELILSDFFSTQKIPPVPGVISE
jgi:hypothetical protein